MSVKRDTLLNRPDLLAKHAAKAVVSAIRRNLSRGISVAYARDGVLYRRSTNGGRMPIGRVGED